MSTTKKILKTVALAGAVTATGAVAATTAHADTTNAPAQQSATTDAQSQLNNLKDQQQASETAMAKDNQKQIDAATQEANSKIDQLNNQLQKQQAEQAAQDKQALADGTAKINEAAQQATDKENNNYQKTVADQEAQNKQILDHASEHLVTPAQKQTQSNSENTRYQGVVNDAKTAHDQANAQLKQDYDNAHAKIDDQISAVKNHQSAEQRQKLDEATRKVDAKINDATDAARTANAKVNADQSHVQSSQTAVTNAQNELNSAKSALENAKEQEKGNRTLSTDYPHIIVTRGDNNDYSTAQEKFQGKFEPWEDNDPTDMSTKLTFNADGKLSEHDQNIANVFAANIINHMRQQIGTPLVSVTSEGNAMQNRLMDLDHQLTGASWHDLHHTEEATDQLMREHAIIGRAENAAESTGTGSDGDVPTVADLKNEIYSQINEWLSEENNVDYNQPYGHRYILLGVNGYGVNNPVVALTTRVIGNGVYCTFLDIYNMGSVASQHVVPLTNNGMPSNGSRPSFNIPTLELAVTNAQNKLDNANRQLSAAKTALTSDKAAANKANDKLNALKASREADIKALAGSAASIADKISALNKQASDLADSYMAKVKDENKKYNTKLDALKADHEKKLAAIAAQPSDVNELKASLAKKMDELKAKHEANLKKINDDAQAKIDALKKQLDAKNAAANKPILDQIAQIKADLANKKRVLASKLEALKAQDSAAYAALHDKLYPKKNVMAVGNQEIVLPGNSNHHEALPQTGNTNSTALVALGVIASMFGLSFAAKKRN